MEVYEGRVLFVLNLEMRGDTCVDDVIDMLVGLRKESYRMGGMSRDVVTPAYQRVINAILLFGELDPKGLKVFVRITDFGPEEFRVEVPSVRVCNISFTAEQPLLRCDSGH